MMLMAFLFTLALLVGYVALLMRTQKLDAERRASERQWARRAKQIDAVTFNIAGMYGDLQGMVALPPIRSLELPEAEAV